MLTAALRRTLRQKAHHLKPVVLVGQNGVTAAVTAAVDQALLDHELIKVRCRGADRESRQEMAARLASELGAELVNLIGGTMVLFRRNPDSKTDWSKR